MLEGAHESQKNPVILKQGVCQGSAFRSVIVLTVLVSYILKADGGIDCCASESHPRRGRSAPGWPVTLITNTR